MFSCTCVVTVGCRDLTRFVRACMRAFCLSFPSAQATQVFPRKPSPNFDLCPSKPSVLQNNLETAQSTFDLLDQQLWSTFQDSLVSKERTLFLGRKNVFRKSKLNVERVGKWWLGEQKTAKKNWLQGVRRARW